MPKELEQKLKRQASKRGYGKERTGAFVYGTLRKTGWTPSTQKKSRVVKAIRRKKKITGKY